MVKLYGRDCVVKSVEFDVYKSFLENYHEQGYARARVVYGLFFDDELVQLMSFGVPRFNKSFQWEIIRECTKVDYCVVGGCSKLWKFFLGNNECYSCICYHYPHDGAFTDHLVNFCGFRNVRKAKKVDKVVYVGNYGGEEKWFDKSLLERFGVDKLLGGNFGCNRSNEEILLDLGFVKEYRPGFSPQVDIYYPYGQLFKVDDLTDSSFFIGLAESEDECDDFYLGSGQLWNIHLKEHPDSKQHCNRKNKSAHLYEKSVLGTFGNPKDALRAFTEEVKKYFVEENGEWVLRDKNCFNDDIIFKRYSVKDNTCSECGGKRGIHFKWCSHAIICPECKGANNNHKKGCSKAHVCSKCGGVNGHHKKTCSEFSYAFTCPECGTHNNGAHKKECKYYKAPKNVCKHCGTPPGGKHKKDCPNFVKSKVCKECGYLLSSNTHAPTCSHYKDRSCSECGNKTRHKKGCPNSKDMRNAPENVCNICGWGFGMHAENCSGDNND